MCKNPPRSPKTLIYIIFYDIDAYTNSILSMPYISGLVLVVSADELRFRYLRWCFVPGDGPDSQHHQGSVTDGPADVWINKRSWCHTLVELKSHLVVSNINFIFHFIYGMSSFPLTKSYFSRWLKPPTSDSWWFMHMAPGPGASIRWYDWYVVVDGEFGSLSTYWVMWIGQRASFYCGCDSCVTIKTYDDKIDNKCWLVDDCSWFTSSPSMYWEVSASISTWKSINTNYHSLGILLRWWIGPTTLGTGPGKGQQLNSTGSQWLNLLYHMVVESRISSPSTREILRWPMQIWIHKKPRMIADFGVGLPVSVKVNPPL